MKIVDNHEVKSRFSSFIEKVLLGADIVGASLVKSAVRLVRLNSGKRQRKLGVLKTHLVVGPEFFEPLPDDELARWE